MSGPSKHTTDSLDGMSAEIVPERKRTNCKTAEEFHPVPLKYRFSQEIPNSAGARPTINRSEKRSSSALAVEQFLPLSVKQSQSKVAQSGNLGQYVGSLKSPNVDHDSWRVASRDSQSRLDKDQHYNLYKQKVIRSSVSETQPKENIEYNHIYSNDTGTRNVDSAFNVSYRDSSLYGNRLDSACKFNSDDSTYNINTWMGNASKGRHQADTKLPNVKSKSLR